MKKLVLSFIVFSLVILSSCGGDANKNMEEQTPNNVDNQLDFSISEKYQTLDPIEIGDVVSFTFAYQIYECLLRFDNIDLSVKPMLAESWDVSENGLTYTFKIKRDVYFHDNTCFNGGKGRELKAQDIVYSFRRICSGGSKNYSYKLFKDLIKGAQNFAESDEEMELRELEGVKALDDYTVVFKLTHKSSNFLNSLAIINGAIVAKEAIEKNEIVGTGPFLYSAENDKDTEILFQKNPNYHILDADGKRQPYIDAVSYKYMTSGQDQLDAFIEEKLDAIGGIPPNTVKEFVEKQISSFQKRPPKYILSRNKKLMTSYLYLNNATKPFNDKRVRKAIAMAIDKNRIIDNILKGEAYGPANHGIVPPFMKNYNFSSVIGLEYNVKKAKELLAEAGYKNGKNIPKITFTTTGSNLSIRVALDIQKQLLANLNINLEISRTSLAESMEMNIYGKGSMSMAGWLADYPDPANFLSLAYGGYVPKSIDEPSFPNSARYVNPEFDKIYEKIIVTLDEKEKNELCLAADQILANDVPIIPLWYQEKYGLVQANVKNYYPNPMGIMYLANVKIDHSSSSEKSKH